MSGDNDPALKRRECDRCSLRVEYAGLRAWLKSVEADVKAIQSRDWKIAIGIIVLLLTGIGNIALHFMSRPDANAIAQQVITLMHTPPTH